MAPHSPVMVEEVVGLLRPRPADGILDLTVGAGGHALTLLPLLGEEGCFVGVDQDADILARARQRLDDPKVELVEGNFGDIGTLVNSLPRQQFDCVLLDLGVSSLQLDTADRGFSFRHDGPLDMRMSRKSGRSARELVNEAPVDELETVIREYGEERFAGRIARAIDSSRRKAPIETTGELAEIVRRAQPRKGNTRDRRIDPATRTFQGIRIAVNRELDVLDGFLARFDRILAPGGRLAILSYHSLEDRRVKQVFRQRASEGDYELLTPRPQRPGDTEIEQNPRARSARLRGLRKRERDERV